MLGEVLFYLALRRQVVGQLGIEGYFSVQQISDDLQVYGFDPADTQAACLLLLTRYLVNADHMNNVSLTASDCIKITAAGYIHLRTLSGEIEYLYAILPTTRLSDVEAVNIIVDIVKRESTIGVVSIGAKVFVVRRFFTYLKHQAAVLAQNSGRTFDIEDETSGIAYLLRQMRWAIAQHDKSAPMPKVQSANVLD